jgi:hypothetical protein
MLPPCGDASHHLYEKEKRAAMEGLAALVLYIVK